MGYSKETSNYKLPQYLADDRPSYLGDWNEAMGTIDMGMEANKESIANTNVAVANMKTYVDNSISDNKTYVDTTVKTLNDKVATLNTSVTALEDSTPLFTIPENGTMVCIGDSWLEGYSSQGNFVSWGTRLASYLGIQGNNFYKGGAGFYYVSGGKTFNTLVNEAAVNNSNASLVVIGGGINDRNSTASDVKSAVTACIKNTRSKFPNAIIWVFPMMLSNRYLGAKSLSINKAICDGISESGIKNVFYNSHCWSWIYDSDNKCADTLHPNQSGQNTVAENMAICMGGGDPYVEYAGFNTSTSTASGMFVRCGTTVCMYLVNTNTIGDGKTLASFPIKYTPGTLFGTYLDAGAGGAIKAFNTANTSSAFNVRPAYGGSSQFYSNFTYPINDNG